MIGNISHTMYFRKKNVIEIFKQYHCMYQCLFDELGCHSLRKLQHVVVYNVLVECIVRFYVTYMLLC